VSRVPQLRPDQPDLDAEQRDLLDQTRKQVGRVPNMYATIANAPAVLRGYLALREALTGGALTDRVREQLALLTAQGNGCAYCDRGVHHDRDAHHC
jgi:alkylhydroperoxidase family enzyme